MTPGQCNAQWTWNFGDGSGGATIPNPIYQWDNNGSYVVTLLVSNNAGSDTVQQTITVTN
jgi:PKD repeat protein